MSQEDLTRFLKAVREDPSLQEQLKAEGADPVAIAKEAGFSITRAELIRHQSATIQELSDEELETAAGGNGSKHALVNLLKNKTADQRLMR